jgi:hypothetical protein
MKVKWLLKHTDLQKQRIAKMVKVNNSTITYLCEDDSRTHRRQRELTAEQLAEYNDYCEYLDDLMDELMGV